MRLSISNIAWNTSNDEEMHEFVKQSGFSGIEIAPTRIFPLTPYDSLDEAKTFAMEMRRYYNLQISSMQSIWYGKNERIFGTEEERKSLIQYTKKSIDFAYTIGCSNLVFGCPKNRIIGESDEESMAIDFFKVIGEYATKRNIVIAIEPNPTIYGTNFINTTKQAIQIARDINCNGIKINLDFGTIIQNNESLDVVKDNIDIINHVHISEPYLELIKKRNQHKELANLLRESNYEKFVSIEMKNLEHINLVKETMEYIKGVFG